MMSSRLQQCHMCFRQVAGRDPESGWCRGCIIKGFCSEVDQRVLLAVRKHQPCLMHDVADEVGFASVSTAIYHLRKLRELGLVHWEDGKTGTLTESVGWPEGERV